MLGFQLHSFRIKVKLKYSENGYHMNMYYDGGVSAANNYF